MLRIVHLLTVPCLVVLVGFLATGFLQVSPVFAEEMQSATTLAVADVSKPQVPMKKSYEEQKPKKACGEGEGGCMSQSANGEFASDGAQCMSGNVCSNPGTRCSLSGARCTNHDLGGGQCTCSCL